MIPEPTFPFPRVPRLPIPLLFTVAVAIGVHAWFRSRKAAPSRSHPERPVRWAERVSPQALPRASGRVRTAARVAPAERVAR